MYADDTTLHNTYDPFHDTDNSDITAITHNINTELSRIVTWLTQNILLTNTSTTKITVFHMPKKTCFIPNKTLIDEEIYIVSNFKFICIILNKHMKWTSHTKSIANTISKYTRLINRPTLTHHYNAIQDILQPHMTIHSFSHHNCIHAMIDQINKHLLT